MTDTETCPNCGKTDTLDGFDVLGADPGCLFCTDCHCHFDEDGVPVGPFRVWQPPEDKP